MLDLRETIEKAWEGRAALMPASAPIELRDAVHHAVDLLDRGTARVAEKVGERWVVHEWLKKAVVLYFRLHDNRLIDGGFDRWWDKVPLKHAGYDAARFRDDGARIVPPAVVRWGAYVAPDAILMPSYVNIGAYIGAGTMVDTWATIGSCAQIGRNCHISGGAGVGGVLEPVQAAPCIVEDDCFVGARCEIAEGVIVEQGSVLSMGVFLGQSTRIYDRERDEVSYGRVPAGSVVVPGTLPSGDGRYGLYAAVIVKRVDSRTRSKTALNELLRDVKW
jgi:2,3,4,5-tetrahydropyridine-2-carboxylate N-succinyltransferase